MLSFSHSILCLSGTLQGAGGVGGLLAVVRDDGGFAPTYDANGNVSEYIQLSAVQTDNYPSLPIAEGIVAHYEYDAFGNTVVQSGSLADTFTHRFSTKPWCPVTSLIEYLFRPNSPSLDRWLSRDPIGEAVQRNIYAFIRNNPVHHVDLLGLLTIYIGGAGEQWLDQLGGFQVETGSDMAFPWKPKDAIIDRIEEFGNKNPCEPIILIGHSYGGDTAMKLANHLVNEKKTGRFCGCLFVITLDPVSHFNADTWFWKNPRPEKGIDEWINVAQPAGIADYIIAIPVAGWAFGGLWSTIGGIVGNDNMIASGGGQWNAISGPDITIKWDGDHHNVKGMLDKPFKDSFGREIKLRDYLNELKNRSCCAE